MALITTNNVTWSRAEKLLQNPSLREMQRLWKEMGCLLWVGSSSTWCLLAAMVAPTRF